MQVMAVSSRMTTSTSALYASYQSQRELLLVIVIIGLVVAVLIPNYANAVFKATLMEPIYLMSLRKMELVESVALTGTWEDAASDDHIQTTTQPQLRRAAGRKRIASARDLEETNVGLARSEAAAAGIEALATRRQSSSNAIVGLSNGIPMAVVASSFVDTPSIIEMRPVINPAAPAVVNWLCGRQQSFSGLLAVPPREPAVPDSLLPITCRNRL
jgi:Tfp pilus assembly protein PilE